MDIKYFLAAPLILIWAGWLFRGLITGNIAWRGTVYRRDERPIAFATFVAFRLVSLVAVTSVLIFGYR